MLRLLLVLVLMSSSFLRASEMFEYRIPRYASDAQNCESELARISPEFEKQSGQKLYHAACSPNGNRFDIVLSYVADQKLDLISTKVFFPYIAQSGFRYLAHCQKDLDLELQHFRAETGLEPIIAYCEDTNSEPGLYSVFQVRIDAFGTPKNRPFTFESMILPNIKKDIVLYQTKFEEAKTDRLSVSRVRFFGSSMSYTMSYHYYAPAHMCIGNDLLLTFKEKTTCSAYEAELGEILTHATDRPLGTLCGEWGLNSETYLVSIKDHAIVYSEKAPQEFGTNEACQSERPSILKFYQDTLKKKVLGGLCISEKGQPTNLTLILERPAPKDCF